MNKTQKINLIGGLVMMLAILVHATIEHIMEIREQRKIRKEIADKTVDDLRAIHVAEGVIHERVNNGHYDDLPMHRRHAQMQEDLKFETIVAANRK